jgi:putative hydrolase of the HAD superfamily
VTAKPATLFVDADNTLWDTDAVFAAAQRQLLADVAVELDATMPEGDQLVFLRAVDQALAERHHARLRYPPRLLIQAVELTLDGMSADAAARAAWKGSLGYRLPADAAEKIEYRYFAALAMPPELRPGVLDGLERLRAAGNVMLVISEGAKARVERTLARLDLAKFFDRVLEAPKVPELYQRLRKLTGTPERAFMVGDQLERDIVPARKAGVTTIYFPGGFQPRWSPAVGTVGPDYIIASFAEVPAIIEAEIAGGRRGAATG